MIVVKVALFLTAVLGLAGGIAVCAGLVARRHLRQISRDLDRLADWRRRG